MSLRPLLLLGVFPDAGRVSGLFSPSEAGEFGLGWCWASSVNANLGAGVRAVHPTQRTDTAAFSVVLNWVWGDREQSARVHGTCVRSLAARGHQVQPIGGGRVLARTPCGADAGVPQRLQSWRPLSPLHPVTWTAKKRVRHSFNFALTVPPNLLQGLLLSWPK